MSCAREDGVISAIAGEHDRESNGRNHKDDCRPGSELGEEGGCAARAECRLRTLTAKGSGEVGGASLL